MYGVIYFVVLMCIGIWTKRIFHLTQIRHFISSLILVCLHFVTLFLPILFLLQILFFPNQNFLCNWFDWLFPVTQIVFLLHSINLLTFFYIRIFYAMEFVGEIVCNILGLNESKYQYVIDSMDANDWKLAKENEERRNNDATIRAAV